MPGAFVLRDRFVVPAQQRQITGVPVSTERVVRVQLESVAELPFGARPVPVVPGVRRRQRVVGARERVVQPRALVAAALPRVSASSVGNEP